MTLDWNSFSSLPSVLNGASLSNSTKSSALPPLERPYWKKGAPSAPSASSSSATDAADAVAQLLERTEQTTRLRILERLETSKSPKKKTVKTLALPNPSLGDSLNPSVVEEHYQLLNGVTVNAPFGQTPSQASQPYRAMMEWLKFYSRNDAIQPTLAYLAHEYKPISVTDDWSILYGILRSGRWQNVPEMEHQVLRKTLQQAMNSHSWLDLDAWLPTPTEAQQLSAMNYAHNIHQQGVLSLLSCGLVEFPPELLSTVEDYLFVNIWQRSLPDVRQEILDLGTAHFGQGWSLAFPLLLTGATEEGLWHLSQSSSQGLMEAAHLALSWPTEIEISRRIVEAYANKLPPRMALDYLHRLPRCEGVIVHYLARNAHQLSELVGTVSSTGTRIPPPAGSALERLNVSEIVAETAMLLENTREYSSACLAYMLAGRYEKLVHLLLQLVQTADGEHWLGQLSSFYDSFLAKPTDVKLSSSLHEDVHLTLTAAQLKTLVYSQAWTPAEDLLQTNPRLMTKAPVAAMQTYLALFRMQPNECWRLKAKEILKLDMSTVDKVLVGRLEAQMIV